jgi:hypothetical protein
MLLNKENNRSSKGASFISRIYINLITQKLNVNQINIQLKEAIPFMVLPTAS